MKWPATEVVVFGVLAALPWVVRVLWCVFAARGRKQTNAEGEPASRRLILLLTLVSLAMLLTGAAYFWIFDPASDALREWLGVRGGLRE